MRGGSALEAVIGAKNKDSRPVAGRSSSRSAASRLLYSTPTLPYAVTLRGALAVLLVPLLVILGDAARAAAIVGPAFVREDGLL